MRMFDVESDLARKMSQVAAAPRGAPQQAFAPTTAIAPRNQGCRRARPSLLLSFWRMHLLASSLTLACLCALAPGQMDKPGPGHNAPGQSSGKNGTQDGDGGAKPLSEKEAAAGGNAEPTKALPPGMREKPFVIRKDEAELAAQKAKLPGTQQGHISFESSCRPRRLHAGEQGTIQVLMLFAGEAVMLDPPPVKFAIERQQGALVIDGEPRFRPAEPAGLAPALKGLRAYDNYAMFDVPFTVDATAQPGSHPFELTIRYDLVSGTKGIPVGSFTDQVAVAIDVVAGQPEEPPAPANTPASGAGRGPGSAPEDASPSTGTATAPVESGGSGIVGTPMDVNHVGDRDTEATPSESLAAVGGDSWVTAIAIAIGVAVVAGLALFVRSRR